VKKIEVVKMASMEEAEPTPGIVRDKAFESKTVLFARSRVPGGTKSAWHHHGDRDVYGFILSGRLRFDFGRGGRSSVQALTGDYFHIPAGLVHRDVNPQPNQEAVVVNIFLGEGPSVFNVSGPARTRGA